MHGPVAGGYVTRRANGTNVQVSLLWLLHAQGGTDLQADQEEEHHDCLVYIPQSSRDI